MIANFFKLKFTAIISWPVKNGSGIFLQNLSKDTHHLLIKKVWYIKV